LLIQKKPSLDKKTPFPKRATPIIILSREDSLNGFYFFYPKEPFWKVVKKKTVFFPHKKPHFKNLGLSFQQTLYQPFLG